VRDLDRLEDRRFLRALGPWLDAAEDDPSCARVLAELRREYERTLLDYHRHDHSAVLRAIDLRERATGVPQPRPASRPEPEADEGPGRAHALLSAARRDLRRLRDAEPSAAVADASRRLDELARAHTRLHREFIGRLHNSAAGSLRRLDWLAEETATCSRPALEVDEPGDAADAALKAALASVRPLLRSALGGRRDLTESEHRQLRHIVAGARADVVRVREHVMGDTRSTGSAEPDRSAFVGQAFAPVRPQRGSCG
jgi:hypothetical protein